MVTKMLSNERMQAFYHLHHRHWVELELSDGREMMVGGMGCRTGGRIIRFYVGRSMGRIKTPLMILRKDSLGGAGAPLKGVDRATCLRRRRA